MHARAQAAILLLPLFFAGAQQPSAPPPAPVLVFSKQSSEVLVPVVVTNKNGEHVHNLKKEDFAVLEDGRHVEITFFEAVHTEARVVEKMVSQDLVSNTLKPQPTQSRLTIIVLDTLNTGYFDQENARREVIRFLSTLEPGEPVALIALSRSGLHVIHDFNQDPRTLALAVKKSRSQLGFKDYSNEDQVSELLPGLAASVADQESASLDAIESESEEAFNNFQQSYSIKLTLQSMRQIAKAFAGVPGRKSVIWATGGIPFSIDNSFKNGSLGVEFLDLYQETWRDLNNANVAVYPLEVNTLTNPGAVGIRVGLRGVLRARRPVRAGNTDNLELFANMTGGRYCAYASDLKQCFRYATEDSGDYYMLAYTIDPTKTKAGWHKIKVALYQDSQYQLRSRSGYYFSQPKPEKNPVQANEEEVAFGLSSPIDYTELPFAVRWSGKPESEDGKTVYRFRFMVGPENLTVAPQTNHIEVTFAALATSNQGQVLANFSKELSGDLQPEMAATIRAKGIVYDGSIAAPTVAGSIRFLVRDAGTGRIGTVKIALPRP